VSVQTHLKNEQILDCYVATRAGEPPDPRTAEHLSDCMACAASYEGLAGFMETLRDTADEEVDLAFPAERLVAQQHAIARRIEHVHRSARVISFPHHETTARPTLGTRFTPRWTAAAAAACLFAGVALGAFIGPDLHRNASRTAPTAASSRTVAVPRPAAPQPVRGSRAAPHVVPDDDEFLSELEFALARPHTRELQAFDALTPHVRDIEFLER
jgi:anti-sigma factor RsiW